MEAPHNSPASETVPELAGTTDPDTVGAVPEPAGATDPDAVGAVPEAVTVTLTVTSPNRCRTSAAAWPGCWPPATS